MSPKSNLTPFSQELLLDNIIKERENIKLSDKPQSRKQSRQVTSFSAGGTSNIICNTCKSIGRESEENVDDVMSEMKTLSVQPQLTGKDE
jgi:hypothetical protein